MKHQQLITTPVCRHDHDRPVLSTKTGAKQFSFYFQLCFVAVALILVVFYNQAPEFGTLGITFVSIFLEALPFMLLGSLVGGFIEAFVSKDTLVRLLPGANLRSIFIAALAGLLFPVCECAIVPVVRRLFQKGLPLGVGIAFLLGAPIVNPLVALSTSVAYGYNWNVAIERMLFGYLIAVTIGFVIGLFFDKNTALVQDATGNHHHEHCSCGAHHGHEAHGWGRKTIAALEHASRDFFDIGRFLVFGAFIAGMLQSVIAKGDFVLLTESPVMAILGMMTLAVILNLCSEADAFIAASFMTTLPFTAQMAFMVLGPMLDIKLIMMYMRVFRIKLIVSLTGLTFIIVFLGMLMKLWGAG